MLKIAIDGNEANVTNRVGSNTYAFMIITELYKLTANRKNIDITVLLSGKKLNDLPPSRDNWRYVIVGPKKFWTQWALPIHLFLHQKDYNILFTPSHYAPRISAIPYVSSVMDLAYLHYPQQFKPNDLLQLKNWTKYSVKNAKKIITISKFSKKEIRANYHRENKDIVVAYPSFKFPKEQTSIEENKNFFREKNIQNKYFLYLGTLQPRKNLVNLIAAYEEFMRKLAASNLKTKGRKPSKDTGPNLVIAGKIGWLADEILARLEKSPFKNKIILTGYIDDKFKKTLYQNAVSSILISLYEGFGIPALESMQSGTIPIVANNSSLPEVVGKAGIMVDAEDIHSISNAMLKIYQMPQKELNKYKTAIKRQSKKFSWQESAKTILKVLSNEK